MLGRPLRRGPSVHAHQPGNWRDDLQVPPILWHKFDEGYQFVLDLFRNDWMVVRPRELKIPVPVVTNEPIQMKTEEKQVYIKRLRRVYRSRDFGPLFDTLQRVLDRASSNLLFDLWYQSAGEGDDEYEYEDGDEDERVGV